MERRTFLKSFVAASLAGTAGASEPAEHTSPSRNGRNHALAGGTLPAWRPGEFQVHFIYTGVAESSFWIMPDGTTMLLDCGDLPAINRGKGALWVLPNGHRHAGEWIARYVTRVNPHKTDVDIMMISHHHDDHAGSDTWGAGVREWKGEKLSVSGFLQAADTLKFRCGFDRGWPDFSEPIPNELCDKIAYRHIRKTIDYLAERDGLVMEKFDVGAVNQVSMRRDPGAFPLFRTVNIAGNGKIRRRDGEVVDLYRDRRGAKKLDENPLSLGLRVEYGPFALWTCGDLKSMPEAEIAKETDPVDVAKLNHHGCGDSTPPELVSALRAGVWVSGQWGQGHFRAKTLEKITSRELYPGPRLVAPCVFSPERRLAESSCRYMQDVAVESFDAGHVVITVAPGGETYTVAYVTADDESMRVTGAYDFVSHGVDA